MNQIEGKLSAPLELQFGFEAVCTVITASSITVRGLCLNLRHLLLGIRQKFPTLLSQLHALLVQQQQIRQRYRPPFQ